MIFLALKFSYVVYILLINVKVPTYVGSDFIWDFGKLPFPTHLGKYFIKVEKISAKIHKIGKIKAIFGLGITHIRPQKWPNKITGWHFDIYEHDKFHAQ